MENENQESSVNEEVTQVDAKKPMSYDDGVIKIDLAELNKPKEDAVQEQETNASYDTVGESENTESSETVVEEVRDTEQNEEQLVQNEEQPVLEEIKAAETQEETAVVETKAEELADDIAEALVNKEDNDIDLPENIQKVVDFMKDTGGSLEDYVRLNQDYSQLNEMQLLREYYEKTKPHLDKEDIDVLMEDFSYDEELDDDRDIRKAKIALKEEVAKAKTHLEGLKSKYYEEIKLGSKLTPEQQKAVQFFNRYNKEQQEATKLAEKRVSTFKQKTEKLFSNEFKGFDFKVGDKQFRFNVKNADQVKTEQSDINNFVKKFLNENNEMSDVSGYHKSLFTAMNPDAIAQHFYEQGKADAIKSSMQKAKNIDMDPRGTHEHVEAPNGWKVRAVSSGVSSSKLKIKRR